MDEFKDTVSAILKTYKADDISEDAVFHTLVTAFTQHGYMKLPGNAKNITITTSDNPNDKLMTREQWEAEVGQA